MKLVCPEDHTVLLEGRKDLNCPLCENTYPVRAGIPRFVAETISDAGQEQVRKAFTFKWTRDTWGYKPEHREVMWSFFLERFGFVNREAVAAFFRNKVVLHAGIGSGQAEQHYLEYCHLVFGADISESVDACQKNWEKFYPDQAHKLRLVQADIMNLPYPDNTFEIVFSDGVLHHTPDTFQSLNAITNKVKPGGKVMFYVYRKKAPIRESTDDYLRNSLSSLDPQTAWDALMPLTALAREMSNAGLRVKITKPVDILEMPAGEWDLQRWLYWHVMKFYWNNAFSFDENNHINFDWYYPTYAWRHTPDEV